MVPTADAQGGRGDAGASGSAIAAALTGAGDASLADVLRELRPLFDAVFLAHQGINHVKVTVAGDAVEARGHVGMSLVPLPAGA